MPRGRRDEPLKWSAAVLFGALCAGSFAAMAGSARAGGFFDFLFGGFEERPALPAAPINSYAEPSAPLSPPPLGPETVRQGGGGGRAVAFCVRLCDGQHFPMEHMVNATPVETCRAMCPASRTKVFFGSAIDRAVARDGARYADLDNAFLYRKQLVANCTCNGKDAFGLAPFEMANDPTLRPGDIVATKNGFLAYTGKSGQAAFTPVDPATVSAELMPRSARVKLSRRAEPPPAPPADDEPGTIVPPERTHAEPSPPVADLGRQAER